MSIDDLFVRFKWTAADLDWAATLKWPDGYGNPLLPFGPCRGLNRNFPSVVVPFRLSTGEPATIAVHENKKNGVALAVWLDEYKMWDGVSCVLSGGADNCIVIERNVVQIVGHPRLEYDRMISDGRLDALLSYYHDNVEEW